MSAAAGTVPAQPAERLTATRRALLFGNFVIGCGVISVAGTLNDLSRSLGVSVSLAGQLITIAAAVMCFGAPLLAGVVAGWDRRRLLALALVWYGAGHVACSLVPSYAALWPVRGLTMLAAAVFSPQAAAAVGFMATPAQRGRAITYVFLGWSVASVAGMPLAAWIGESFGWRWAFRGIAVLALLGAAWVWRALPDGVRPPALSWRDWRGIFAAPLLMAMVVVTALLAAGQFTLFSYFTPYYRQALGADATQIGLLLAWFGAFGLVGNVVLTRTIDRVGPERAVMAMALMIAASLVLWPWAHSLAGMAAVLVPWALACFAVNSAQQARLALAAPALAPALMALNTSAIYLGQALGAAGGGWIVAHGGYAPLSRVALAWVVAGLILSIWATRRAARAVGPPSREAV